MATKMKVTKKISPKDKNKIKATASTTTIVKTDGKKVTSVSRSKNVQNNKSSKWFFQESN